MKYFTRLRVKRIYQWGGRPRSFDRKLKTYEYDSLAISVEGLPRTTVIKAGQHILIEGDDDDNPYVAKVVRLFGDENGEQKKALVQWFVRVSEVPQSKLTLLGRPPHPQEIFFYQGRSCDDEVNAESIIRPVQVKHLAPATPFPDSDDTETLYVKFSWDSKTFREVDSALMDSELLPPPSRSKPSLPPSPPCSPPAATPASRAPPLRALPTPDPTIMRRVALGEATHSRVVRSASKAAVAMEAESLHSASKLSASKLLSAKRRSAAAGMPGVRKKLELCDPEKTDGEDVLIHLLQEDLEKEVTLARRLPSSPPCSPTFAHSLTPLRKANRAPAAQDTIPLKSSAIVLHKMSLDEAQSPPSSARDDSSSPRQAEETEVGLMLDAVRTPRRRSTTPMKNRSTRAKTAATPSRRKDQRPGKEPALGVLAEADDETSSPMPVAATPRSSRRKSALKVSSRIREQLNLLDDQLDFNADEDDEDDFVPSKKELQSSSEEEEDAEDEEEEAGLDSDDEVVVKKSRRAADGCHTPRAKHKTRPSTRTPRKTPSRKSGPSTPRTPRTATPSIPCRTRPARQPANVLEEARTRLHVSSVPESLPCREQEFQDIYSFVESKITDGTGGCMYISGVPGTGKTATVHEVMRCLQHAADVDEIPPFSFIEINGMKMTDPHQAYVQILQKLTGQKATADHAAALLEKRFSNPAPRKESTVLLVDELDLLWTRKQNVMYNLFDWPTRRHARLVVLTIANTMDLPERIMINRVASRLGLTRMSFQPYSFKQLQQIITSRLNKVKAFEEDALQLVSRKVAALSGDARRCLDICRRATEICEQSFTEPSATGLVGMSHVMEALNEMFSSAYIIAIKCASTQEQLFLRAVIAEFRRLGLEEATFQQVFVQHQALCRVEGLQPVCVSEGLAVAQRLGACRLLLLEPSRLGVLQRVRLNVSQDDVLFALKAD
ncbi:LOW QUALITY PROTEIN: origin recognition complex subunit 1 [Melanotaenia boesemani]|uniref:LOW QUALITY PROTEIN: origin recognition complex subunit 1 n=1 Tax=Melanotaenia boesemani TaxID=1250792 RepID=UPI001C050698|nr:LOW QUALITY PROTEIN: origin recognition complex subunit 1 [Melanotaenia boesemani]